MKSRKILFILATIAVIIFLAAIGVRYARPNYLFDSYDLAPPPVKVIAQETKFTDRVQKSIKGVVHIACPQWQGSGFVIGPRMIVTARHCVEGVEDFDITTFDGHQLHATRAISSKESDVAFIWIDDLTCQKCTPVKFYPCGKSKQHKVTLYPLELGNIVNCVLGQSVYVIGSPYGKVNFNSLTTGVISGVDRDWSSVGDDYGWKVAFTVDAAGHPGNSGCPVFTMDGKVRGILVGGFSPVLINVMPCDLFLPDLEQIKMMFALDKYEREEKVYTPYPYGAVIESIDYQENQDAEMVAR
jgi:S1-C subfamily serine protease